MHTRFWCGTIGLLCTSLFIHTAFASPVPPVAASTCVPCHGQTQNQDGRIPKLAGQYQDFIIKQVNDYREQRRDGHPTDLRQLNNQSIADIASYYQQLDVRAVIKPVIQSLGQNLYLQGDASRGVKQCANCHGTDGMGRSPEISMFPVVAGQNKPYIIQSMQEYRDGKRKNDVSGMMTYASRKLSDEDIEAMADYLAGLGSNGSALAQASKGLGAKPRPEIRSQTHVVAADETPIEATAGDTTKTAKLRLTSLASPTQRIELPSPVAPANKATPPPVKEKSAKAQGKSTSTVHKDEKNSATRDPAGEEAELLAKQILNEEQTRKKAAEHGKRKAIACEVCHGKAGISVKKYYPSLTAMSREQMIIQLHAYKDGSRVNPVMQEVTRTLSAADIDDIAAYFATLRR